MINISPRKFNSKPIWLLIAILSLSWILYSNRNLILSKPKVDSTNNPKPSLVANKFELPDSWNFEDSKTVDLKLIKTSDGYNPTIVLTSTTINVTNPSKYVDSLIKGAKATIPNLTILNDFSPESQPYQRLIKASYVNQKQKIYLLQKIYLISNKAYTLTASYMDESIENELNSIFDSIYRWKISP